LYRAGGSGVIPGPPVRVFGQWAGVGASRGRGGPRCGQSSLVRWHRHCVRCALAAELARPPSPSRRSDPGTIARERELDENVSFDAGVLRRIDDVPQVVSSHLRKFIERVLESIGRTMWVLDG